nr:immunoglobulin heavy chain junction region [Macaca mulatta]MPN69297.1 immunoglobulin heavy chain junction region [Macaca mulatta]MPN69445.1 immunoglobulin heavy chain junction region [Macaca mulatta]MPN69544.1 immunoglobulin heavy chain junction region [Macaca mulatta]MPN69653.1 immunoglobulin heavy chain junction region [Macaca mulatta]
CARDPPYGSGYNWFDVW